MIVEYKNRKLIITHPSGVVTTYDDKDIDRRLLYFRARIEELQEYCEKMETIKQLIIASKEIIHG